MTDGREVTLNEVLQAREERVARQREMIKAHSVPIVSYLVNMPGAWKCTPLSIKIFNEGLIALMHTLGGEGLIPVQLWVGCLPTGPEALWAVPAAALTLKRMVVQIEEHHPLGRLFDMDVIDRDLNGVSRVQIGKSARKCLICSEDACVCGRSRKHSVDELIGKIQSIVEAYFQK
jgi:holo-ACP synthase